MSNHAHFPISIQPKAGYSAVDVGALGAAALAGLPADEQVYYNNQNDQLIIHENGEYTFFGDAVVTFDVEVTDGDGTWDTVSITVYPLIDLEVPTYTPPVFMSGTNGTIAGADIFNAGLDHPLAALSISGFPGATQAVSKSVQVDAGAAFDGDVTVTAVLGAQKVSHSFRLVISDSAVVEGEAGEAIEFGMSAQATLNSFVEVTEGLGLFADPDSNGETSAVVQAQTGFGESVNVNIAANASATEASQHEFTATATLEASVLVQQGIALGVVVEGRLPIKADFATGAGFDMTADAEISRPRCLPIDRTHIFGQTPRLESK